MAYPFFEMFILPAIINAVIFAIALTIGIITLRKSKGIMISLTYSTAVAVGLFALSSIVLYIAPTLNYFIPIWIVVSLILYRKSKSPQSSSTLEK